MTHKANAQIKRAEQTQSKRIMSKIWFSSTALFELRSHVRWLPIVTGLTVLLASLGVLASAPPVHARQSAATVIKNARVFTTSTSSANATAGSIQSVRIVDDRITALGAAADAETQVGDRVIDATGLYLMAGFIDTHSHHDRGLLDQPSADAAVSQGITTIIVGQDGGSALPIDRFLRSMDRDPSAVNVAGFVGHGSIRRAVMGKDFERAATSAEIAQMKDLVDRAMAQGALGLSTGLEYDPGIYSTTDEVVALAEVVAKHGGRYISHMRSEDRGLTSAIEEIISIGERAKIPVHISHFKLAMKSLHGRASEVIKMLRVAREKGVRISADVYPYDFWQSTMTVLFPDRDFTNRKTAQFALQELAPPEGFVLSWWAPDPSLVGKSLSELAMDRQQDAVDVYLELLAEAQAWEQRTGQGAEMILARSMDTADIEDLYQWEYSNVSSDGMLKDRHPRGAGAFPRFFARIVREGSALSWEQASFKTSALAAENMGLVDAEGRPTRGTLEVGSYADLVLIDPARIRDRATPERPGELAEGVVRVWVNGEAVWDRGRSTGQRPGRALRRPGVVDPRDPSIVSALDEIFSVAGMGSVHDPGCALGVVSRGGGGRSFGGNGRDGAPSLQLARGYGLAHLDSGMVLDEKSVFRLASVSKQFTAATIAHLHLRGLLDLDEPVQSYLPTLKAWGDEVTVRQLVHHSSGVRDYLTLMALAGKRDDDFYTDEEVMEMLERQEELNFEPGSEFVYSNAGYFLLGQIVKAVTGRSLRAVADEVLFEPLGMRNTHFHDDHAHVVPHRADGYTPAAGRGLERWRQSMTTLDMVGDGGAFSNVEDLALWVSELLEPRVFDADFHELIRSRQRLLGGPGSEGRPLADEDGVDEDVESQEKEFHPYAFGLSHGEYRGATRLGHGGAFVGYRTSLATWPDQGLGTVVLCNRADVWADGLSAEVVDLLIGEALGDEQAARERPVERLGITEPVDSVRGARESGAKSGSSERLSETALEKFARPFVGTWYAPELDAVYTISYSEGVLDMSVPPGFEVSLRFEEPAEGSGRGVSAWSSGFYTLRGGAGANLRLDAGRVKNLLLQRRGD